MVKKIIKTRAVAPSLRTLISLLALLIVSSTAHAQDHTPQLALGYSVWGLGEDYDNEMLRLSYELSPSQRFWGVRPLVGLFVNEDSDFYFSTGWVKEFREPRKLSWGIGQEVGYWHGDDHLGHDLEFYSRIFADYNYSSSSFIRLEFGHISNAGLGDRNPGAEIATMSFVRGF